MESAEERRERLEALREAQRLLNTPDEDDHQNGDGDADADGDGAQKQQVKFRNYIPNDKQLQEGKLAPPVLPTFQDPAPAAAPPPTDNNKEDPFLNIAPKKANWDLRRDMQKKLDKLEKKTQKAIRLIMIEKEKERRRLAEESADGENEVE